MPKLPTKTKAMNEIGGRPPKYNKPKTKAAPAARTSRGSVGGKMAQ